MARIEVHTLMQVELDGGWLLSKYTNYFNSWAVLHRHKEGLNLCSKHTTHRRKGVFLLCSKCKTEVPDEVMGFLELIKWEA